MTNLLDNTFRIVLILSGILCALAAFAFFHSPAMVLPYIPILFQFIGSKKRSLVIMGWLLIVLIITCLILNGRIQIDGFRLEWLVILGAPILLLLAGLHLLVVESRKGPRSNPQP
jgi:hypothetical protein